MDDYQYLTPTGVIVPDVSTLLTDVQNEFKAVFGSDLIVDPSTPQGVLVTAETLARTKVVVNNAAVSNQLNPNLAGGVFLDAIMALTGMQRTAQTQTTVQDVTMTGVAGTVIPAGSQARTAVGDLFTTDSAVTLASDGTGSVDFTSLAYGPIPCAANTLTFIVSGVLGWETVNNTQSGVLGSTTQSDQAARALRNNTLAFQGLSLPEAITSALYATAGVKSLKFQENVAATTQTINGISMVAHSVYACVDGGEDSAVADALLENKSSGSAWNGTTSIDVVEPASGQTYTVKFERPDEIGILIKATIKGGNASDVQQALLDYAQGKIEGEAGFVVGANVSCFELAGAVNREFPGIYVQKVETSLTSPVTYTSNEIVIGVNQVARTQLSYISIVILT